MTQTVLTIQIAPESRPSTPSWMGEVAVVAQVLSHMGVLKAIQEQVRFARARFGQYDLIDFVVVLIGSARSFEPTLKAFCERLLPFAEPFMALFGRHLLPHRSTLSRFLAALDQASVETLRTLFQEDLVARNPFASPGGMFDRTGKPWLVVDVDGTRQAARGHCPVFRLCLLPTVVSIRSACRATWDASVERSCAPAPSSSRHIPISFWALLEGQAMGITEENSCELSR